MSDQNGKTNGNGNGLLREMFATGERSMAWLFRLIFSGTVTIALYLAAAQLSEIKAELNAAAKSAQDYRDRQSIMETGMARITQTLSDMKPRLDDHESRIRVLEHPIGVRHN